jgi:hypothetical protein
MSETWHSLLLNTGVALPLPRLCLLPHVPIDREGSVSLAPRGKSVPRGRDNKSCGAGQTSARSEQPRAVREGESERPERLSLAARYRRGYLLCCLSRRCWPRCRVLEGAKQPRLRARQRPQRGIARTEWHTRLRSPVCGVARAVGGAQKPAGRCQGAAAGPRGWAAAAAPAGWPRRCLCARRARLGLLSL